MSIGPTLYTSPTAGAGAGVVNPLVPVAGNEAMLAEAITRAERERLASQAAQLTTFTWVEKSSGIGVASVDITFDCVFLQEPTLSRGASLLAGDPAASPGGIMACPISDAVVRSWKREPSGAYVGALVYLVVSTAVVAAGGTAPDPAGWQLAHHISFTGLAYVPTSEQSASQAEATDPILAAHHDRARMLAAAEGDDIAVSAAEAAQWTYLQGQV